MRVANDVLATFPGHAVKRGLPHQCAVGLGPRVLHSGYQHGGTRWPVSSRCFATIKLLVWDRTGYLLLYKRLERGTFHVPTKGAWVGCQVEAGGRF